MKFSRIALFAFFLGMAGLFFWGCGGGGGDSSSGGTIANPALGNLTGRILQGPPNANIAGVRAAEVVGTTGVAGAEVWLEERPEIRTRSGLDGSFVFADIPEGSYRVVAKLESGLTVLKARSASVIAVLKATSVTIDLTLQPATVRVTGVLRGTDGQPLPTGTKLTLWGETFEIQTGGRFETPPLPEGFFDNEIIIAFAGTSSSFSVPVTFVAAQSPASVDFMVPFGGGMPAGPWHHPPVVSISAKNGTTLTSRVDAGGPLTITAVARDAGDLDRVVPTWSTTRGMLTETADRYVRVWNAPATGGLATVSVLVTDGEGATGTVWLPLLVEGNLSSEKSLTAFSFGTPAVTGTIDQTARTIALTVPFGTDLSALVPTITHSGANLSPVSGLAQNFTSPVTYTVTAADSSTQAYLVTVTVPPVCVLSTTAPNPTNAAIPVTVTFDKDVTGFEVADVVVVNGTKSLFANPTPNRVWTLTVTPTAGAVTVDVAANAAQDGAGNGNTVAIQLARTYDAVAPTCVLSTTAPNPTNAAIPVTITFDKDVTGFDVADVVVVNGTKSLFANPTPNRVWTLTVTPTAGAVTVDVAADAAQDGAGNGNTVATQLARTYDAVAPTCVLSTTAPNPTNAAIPVTITFNEDATGFDVADVVVVNGTKSLFANPTPNRVWTLTVTPTAGAVTVDVAANAAQDGVGNGNTVATQLARTYTGDYLSANIGTLKYVPAGTFQRDATVTNTSTVSTFRMSRNEITQTQFTAVTGLANPSFYPGVAGGPVEKANWYHALVFCNKLSMSEGLTPACTISGSTDPAVWIAGNGGVVPTSSNATWDLATCNLSATGYRLPTEAEWQWAAMGASDSRGKAFAGSTGGNLIDDYVWYFTNSGFTTHAVGGKLANELGIYDLSGNVLEWCWDWFGAYPAGAQTDYSGSLAGPNRVFRGGSWLDSAGTAAVSNRVSSIPSNQSSVIGFRVVRP